MLQLPNIFRLNIQTIATFSGEFYLISLSKLLILPSNTTLSKTYYQRIVNFFSMLTLSECYYQIILHTFSEFISTNYINCQISRELLPDDSTFNRVQIK